MRDDQLASGQTEARYEVRHIVPGTRLRRGFRVLHALATDVATQRNTGL